MNANLSGLGETEELKAETLPPKPVEPAVEAEGAPAAVVDEPPQALIEDQPASDSSGMAAEAPDAPMEQEAVVPDEPAAADTDEGLAMPERTWSAAATGEPAPVEPLAPSAASEAVADQDAAVVEPAPAEGAWLEPDAAEVKMFKRGDVVEGTITATSPTAVYVDIGAKQEAIIPGRELERMNRETQELLRPGSVVPVYIVNPHDHNGDIILSLNRALEERDWEKAEEYRDSQKVYNSLVAGYNKGGLIVRFGRLRGFVPQSQLGADRRRLTAGETPEERWGSMVNQPIAVKVMEVDRARNRLILSERLAARESRESRKESLINELRVGEVRTGRVVSLVDFGAFVDIGGAEGLVHLTELSWKHVTHPRELLSVGQEVRVEVISVDPEAKRIGLSMKRREADPWDTIATDFTIGQLVRGTVTKLTKFGAFTRLVDVPEIEGLIHISELSEQRVNHPREVLQEGQTVTLRVVKIDIENRRLGLSLKRVNSPEYLDVDWSSLAE